MSRPIRYLLRYAINHDTRTAAYDQLSSLFVHLGPLSVDLVRLDVKSGKVEVELSALLPELQIAHLGLTGPL